MTERQDNELKEVSRFRTLLEIVEVCDLGGGREFVVVANVPGWNPDKEVAFSVDAVSEELRGNLKPRAMFLAEVNLAAEESHDLNPTNFELAPPPAEDLLANG